MPRQPQLCGLCNKMFVNLKSHLSRKKPCSNKPQYNLFSPMNTKNIPSPKSPLPVTYKNSVFNKNQLAFINDPLCDAKLIGIPGGGKTRSIIEKIKVALENGELADKSEYMILTFSRMACNDFIVKGKQVMKKFNRNNVRTLHSLAGKIVSSVLGRSSSSIETIIISAMKLLEKDVYEEKIKEIAILKNLKVIFVDEAQDISNCQYQFILRLKERLGCYVIMVGDPNQNIYQFQGGSDKYMLDYVGKTYLLTDNYRSTENIVKFVNQISPHENEMISKRAESGCDNPLIKIFVDNYQNIEKDILDEIKNSKYDLHDIAIIGPVKLCKPKDESYTNIGLSIATNLLYKNKIPFIKHYDDANTDARNAKVEKKDGHINILTVHGSKGLEFKKVILLNFHFKTFGGPVTIESYNRFKYMWYVACSRAENEMTIYIEKDKPGWSLLRNVDPSLYEIKWKSVEPKKLVADEDKFDSEMPTLIYSVTDFLKDLTPEQAYILEDMFKYSYKEIDLFSTFKIDALEHDTYSVLYGNFMEQILAYQYYLHKNTNMVDIFNEFLIYIESLITIPKKFSNTCKSLLSKLTYSVTEELCLNMFEPYKASFTDHECKLYDYLSKTVEHDYNKPFYIEILNDLTADAKDEVIEICKYMVEHVGDEKYPENIFKIVLYRYQKENEAGYLWSVDFSEHIESIRPIINSMLEFVKGDICNDLDFWKRVQHPNFPIRGEIDIVKGETEIIDIKFTKTFHNKQVFQLLFYYNNLFPAWNKEKKLCIWNLYHGKAYEIDIENIMKNYDLLRYICDITGKKLDNMIFLYDLETTSLDTFKCEIIDRHFEEYNLRFSPSSGLVKPNKRIPDDVIELTGITNKMVEDAETSLKMERDMLEIFKYCSKPAFMAHNGYSFDHMVMKNKRMFETNTTLLDSKYIIRLLHVNDTKAMRLEKIYKEVMGVTTPYVAHRAEADVMMMVDILIKLGYSYP